MLVPETPTEPDGLQNQNRHADSDSPWRLGWTLTEPEPGLVAHLTPPLGSKGSQWASPELFNV